MCKKQCGAMTHQETTDRINALTTALEKISNVQSMPVISKELASNLNASKEYIAFELAQLVRNSAKAALQPPKSPTSQD